MTVYKCKVCGFIYDPSKGVPDFGIEAGIPFDELPEDWTCPECGATKWMFVKVEDEK
ncbi:MAG: rubredoxin [Peptoniphilus sp.]|nr:rubredoxin [Peptoniphilus sp.]MDD7362642.1 rubredoxin [Bacillota bacterium]MDY6044959.1 rubredoxin [Peptoniphilus sp.]